MRIGFKHIVLFVVAMFSILAQAQVYQKTIYVNKGTIRTFRAVGDTTVKAFDWYINEVKVADSALTFTDTIQSSYSLMVVPISKTLVPVSNSMVLGDTFAINVNAKIPDYVAWADTIPPPLCLIIENSDTSFVNATIGMKLKNLSLSNDEYYKVIYSINEWDSKAFIESDTIDSIAVLDKNIDINTKKLGLGKYAFSIKHFYLYSVDDKKQPYVKYHIDLSNGMDNSNKYPVKIELKLNISIKPKIGNVDFE